MKCYITLENRAGEDVSVNLLADFKLDAEQGLLKSPILSGYHKEGGDEFLIPANSKKEYQVIFIGDFAGKPQKQNRNLPSIEINVVQKK